MSTSRVWARVAALATVLVVALTSCNGTGGPTAAKLPSGEELVRNAATEMATVQTVRFGIDITGSVSGILVRRADGQLTREGNARGTAQIDQNSALIEVEFVIVGQNAYIKGATGGYQRIPLALASAVYDPSAILDPNRGVARLLATARDARTEARESVGGQEAYRVSVTLDRQALATLVPGVTQSVTGELWIDTDRPRLLQARFPMPSSTGGPGATVTATFSDFDAPVTVTPPTQ